MLAISHTQRTPKLIDSLVCAVRYVWIHFTSLRMPLECLYHSGGGYITVSLRVEIHNIRWKQHANTHTLTNCALHRHQPPKPPTLYTHSQWCALAFISIPKPAPCVGVCVRVHIDKKRPLCKHYLDIIEPGPLCLKRFQDARRACLRCTWYYAMHPPTSLCERTQNTTGESAIEIERNNGVWVAKMQRQSRPHRHRAGRQQTPASLCSL